MLYDITRVVGVDTLTYPGDPEPAFEQLSRISDGAPYNLTAVNFSCHCGTHIDAPLHFTAQGAALDQLPISRFILRAHVIDTTAVYELKPAVLDGAGIQPGDAVLFKTRNAALPRICYHPQLAGITPLLAQRLVELGIGLAGIDYLSPELEQEGHYPVHQTLLGAGVLILEDADLSAAPPGTYRLYCLPLKLGGAEAAPCRAVLETLD